MGDPAGREMGRRILDAIRGFVARSYAPLAARVLQLEQKAAEPRKDGASPPADDVQRMAENIAAAAVAKLQLPRDGRDALELTVLPAIDEKRSYPRNTYARHRGGLWRAFEDTLGLRGWECVVVGVHEVYIGQKDERLFTLALSLSAGEPLIKEFVLPIVIDRGVYRPEQKYAKGDGVTFGGSFWIAQVDEPTEKPGIPAPGTPTGATGEWRLAVKKGRDGKDAGAK